jgi:hypothetical protein
MEWVSLARVPELARAGEIWNSGTLVALMGLLTLGESGGSADPAGIGREPAGAVAPIRDLGKFACSPEVETCLVFLAAEMQGGGEAAA